MGRRNALIIGLVAVVAIIAIVMVVRHNNQVAAANKAHHDWVQQHVSM